MEARVICVAVLMLLSAVTPACGWTCPRNCTCWRDSSYLFAECPSTKPTLAVRNMFKTFVEIICNDPAADLKLLQSFDLGPIPHVRINRCPLPDTNYSVLLDNMGARDYSKLDIWNKTLPARDLRDRLIGLDMVTSLSLNGLGLADVPADFLQAVPKIRYLDLKYNRLRFPQRFFDYVPNLQTLEISMNDLDFLEPGIFRYLNQLYSLSAHSNRLLNITRETFTGLNKIVKLNLGSNGIQELPDDVFAELHELKRIYLNANNFTGLLKNLFRNTSMLEVVRLNHNHGASSLPPGLLANLTSLREAYLHRMFLSSVPEDLFHGSGSLVNVTLCGNNLRRLPAGLFRDAVHLLRLDLSSNELEHLPDDVFTALSELQFLHLGSNKLASINEKLFANIFDITTLHLQQNAISEVHQKAFFNLMKLKSVDISGNMVSFKNTFFGGSSPFTNCRSLEYLLLAHNYIETIFQDWRNVLLYLKLLDLSHNKLTFIEVTDLMFLSPHVKVNLTHNKISSINLYGAEPIAIASIGTDGGAKKNVTAYLDNNPLRCDCGVYDFLRYLQFKISPEVHSMFELVPGNLECVSPPTYAGMRVSVLPEGHFVCGCDEEELQKRVGCPRNCTCCLKPFSKALVVDCSNSRLSRAPDELPLAPDFRVTQTQLLLQRNSITSLPNATQPGYENVTLIDVSHNRLRTLHVAQLPGKLKVLNLNHNNLTRLDQSVLRFLANGTSVTLQANQWTCSCDNRDLLSFLLSHFKQVPDFHSIMCETENRNKLALSEMTVDELCPTDIVLFATLGVTIGVVGLVMGAIVTLYYRYQQEVKVWLYAHNMLLWWVTEEELDKEKLFDAFVSFSHKDEDFVVNDLVPGLEGGPKPFRLCLHFRDWIAGEFIPLQIARSVGESRRTLVVLSPNFLESVWGRMEFRAAHQQALSEGRARVILLLYGNIGPLENLDPELKAYLSTNTYVKWGDPWFWDKLRYALPHRPPMKQTQYHITAAAVSDKMDLMFPAMSTPTATTPPAVSTVPVIECKATAQKGAVLNGQMPFSDSRNESM